MAERPDHAMNGDAAAYVLGALSPEEAVVFEAALAADPALQREVRELQQVAGDLALGADAPPPPSDLRERVLQRVRSMPDTAVSTVPSTRSRLPVLLALAASVAAVGVFGAAWLRARQDNAVLASALETARLDIERTTADLAERERLLSVLLSPTMQLDLVTSTGATPPVLRLFRDPSRGLAIAQVTNLPPATAGRTYQLWFIRDGAPVPSVTFNTSANGQGTPFEVTLPAGGATVTHAAVTEEPTGGSAQPTTTPFLVGELGRRE